MEEIENELTPEVTPTCLRDQLDRVYDMLTCLYIMLSGNVYQAYPSRPHQILLLEIKEKVRKIEQDLKHV